MKAPIVVLTMVLLAGRANAQMNYPTNLPTESGYTIQQNAQPIGMSASRIEEISRDAQKQNLADGLNATTRDIVSKNIQGATDQLISGKNVNIAARIGSETNIIDQHSVNVHISYDARPIGGILNVRVELLPVFSGIGSAVRPTISREFAEAVDNFDDEFIAQTILRLTKELSENFAAKS